MKKKKVNKKTEEVGYFDFNTPTQESGIKAGKSALIIAIGIIAAKAAMAAVPEKYNKYAKGGVALAGVLIGASAQDPTIQLAASGIAALQVTGLISEVAKKNLELTENTTFNNIVKAGLGINGGESASADFQTEYTPITSTWYPTEETVELELQNVNIPQNRNEQPVYRFG